MAKNQTESGETVKPDVESTPVSVPAEPGKITDYDLHLYAEGNHQRLWEMLGAHVVEWNGVSGTRFAVWAPNAASVSVVGSFNDWQVGCNPLQKRGNSGVWEGFVPGVGQGALYKYAIHSNFGGYQVQKADPVAFTFEMRPQTASVVWKLDGYSWGDAEFMANRPKTNAPGAPLSIYEVHLGSWMRNPEEGNCWLTYREIAPKLAAYCQEMGFSHVELLPLSEHPFDGSWGYQTVGYFAPTSRFGSPQDFMFLVDTLHQHGIGVILDWVPAHFPKDEHGLGYFDGTHVYEHADPRQGTHKDWGTSIFNFGRNEVRNFLLSNALYWLEVFHIDGLRVDAVASMLYLDYSREPGEWVPNQFGGRENLEAVDFLKKFNQVVQEKFPDVLTIAEESTAWPMVSGPLYLGGLGFSNKWNMGWMHDTLSYHSKDPVYRSYHHHQMTFALIYAFNEKFVLALSHDEVVHGKGSLLGKMPGDRWRKFANLRLLFAYMWTHPGKKLVFMGGEFGQAKEWNHDFSLDWHLLEDRDHEGVRLWVKDLNHLLLGEGALHELDFQSEGFEWIDCNDATHCVYSFIRWDKARKNPLVCVFNFTPIPRYDYRLGVPVGGRWNEVLNSDAEVYGGGNMGNGGGVEAVEEAAHGFDYSIIALLPPLGALVFRLPEPCAESQPLPEDRKPRAAMTGPGHHGGETDEQGQKVNHRWGGRKEKAPEAVEGPGPGQPVQPIQPLHPEAPAPVVEVAPAPPPPAAPAPAPSPAAASEASPASEASAPKTEEEQAEVVPPPPEDKTSLQ